MPTAAQVRGRIWGRAEARASRCLGGSGHAGSAQRNVSSVSGTKDVSSVSARSPACPRSAARLRVAGRRFQFVAVDADRAVVGAVCRAESAALGADCGAAEDNRHRNPPFARSGGGSGVCLVRPCIRRGRAAGSGLLTVRAARGRARPTGVRGWPGRGCSGASRFPLRNPDLRTHGDSLRTSMILASNVIRVSRYRLAGPVVYR